MLKPIADFESATGVVVANAKLSYGELNRVEMIRAVKTAARLHQRLDPKKIEKVKVLTGEDLATRLDALEKLDEYSKLLSSIVKSDLPSQIANSASEMETALNGLADRIDKLSEPAAAANGEAGEKPNTRKFKETFGVFSAVAREVLGFLARKKRDEALKRAIRDGDKPVNELITALQQDLTIAWIVARKNLDDDMVLVFRAYNTEAVKEVPSQDRLNELADAVIANLEAQDLFYATDPNEALNNMKTAHGKMVEYANRPTESSFTETIAAIDTFVSSAARLGSAVVKLRTVDANKS